MEQNKKTLNVAETIGFVVIGMVVVPLIINTGYNIGVTGYNKISEIKHNRKIKKGLKDGSIVEVDGEYYEVEKVIDHVIENDDRCYKTASVVDYVEEA